MPLPAKIVLIGMAAGLAYAIFLMPPSRPHPRPQLEKAAPVQSAAVEVATPEEEEALPASAISPDGEWAREGHELVTYGAGKRADFMRAQHVGGCLVPKHGLLTMVGRYGEYVKVRYEGNIPLDPNDHLVGDSMTCPGGLHGTEFVIYGLVYKEYAADLVDQAAQNAALNHFTGH